MYNFIFCRIIYINPNFINRNSMANLLSVCKTFIVCYNFRFTKFLFYDLYRIYHIKVLYLCFNEFLFYNKLSSFYNNLVYKLLYTCGDLNANFNKN
jgi:hypothetical protein